MVIIIGVTLPLTSKNETDLGVQKGVLCVYNIYIVTKVMNRCIVCIVCFKITSLL